MTTAIKILRKDFIAKLQALKDDNISIVGIGIDRNKLLQALKLQTQNGADVLTINYGTLGWHYDWTHHAPEYKYGEHGNQILDKNSWFEFAPYDKKPEPCIQICCDHTKLRFFNRPRAKRGFTPEPIPLNFIDTKESPRQANMPIGIPLDTKELIKALNLTLTCCAKDDTRPPLRCILFEAENDTLKLVSTDGFRLAKVTLPATGISLDGGLLQDTDVIKLLTFLKAIKPTGRGTHKIYPEVYFAMDYDKLIFSTKDNKVESNKFRGTFPKYEQLIPREHSISDGQGNEIKSFGTKAEFIASEVLQAVKSVSQVAKDGSGIIRLNFDKINDIYGKLTISARSEELGNSDVECDCKLDLSNYHKDKPCHIAINHIYFLDYLSQLGDSLITMHIFEQSKPMVFDIDNFTCVIMPMFVQW